MKLLDSLLEKYKDLRPPNDTVRKEICSLLKETYSIDVPYEKVIIKESTIIINVHPSIKNTVFINKHSILKKLNRSDLVDIR